MPIPYANMEDIIYCHNEGMAKELFDFLREKGYTVGLSSSQISTGTHGEQVVKRLDVYKKEPKLIKTWDELKECVSETHELKIEDCSGWIRRKDGLSGDSLSGDSFFDNNHYLSTHTFYGSAYKHSTKLLQKCGFNVRLENWDA